EEARNTTLTQGKPGPAESGIDVVGIEAGRIVEHLCQVLSGRESSAILRRGSSSSVYTGGQSVPIPDRANLLQPDAQLPRVAVVVEVVEDVARFLQGFIQSHFRRRCAFVFAFLDVERTEEEL